MAQYWLRVGEETYGPYDADEARRYAGPDSLVSSGGDWLALGVHPDFAADGAGDSAAKPQAQQRPARRRRGCGCKVAALLLVGLPLGVGVLGLGGWGAWRFYESRYPPFDPSVTLPPYSWTPPKAPHAGYVSPPLDVEPAPGLRIRAQKGALDAPRQFTARRLASGEIDAARARLERSAGPPLAGFDVSCGMAEGDRFRRPVRMAFDLQALGVDRRLWRQAQVVMTDGAGRPIPMASSLVGSELQIGTPHNGPIFIVIGLSTIAGLVKYGLTDPDLAQELEGKEWVGITTASGRFRILWPAVEHRPDAIAETLRKELEEAWKEYACATSPPTPAPGVPSRWPSLDAYRKHLAVQIEQREKVASDRQWLLTHWAHPAALPVAKRLDWAFDYLDGVRRFSAPGAVVNIYLRKPWNGGADEYGLAENLKTRRPYIGINMTKLPALSSGQDYQGEADAELTLTTLHELFHVFQSQYFSIEWGRYTWLNEAAALTLERELWDDYGHHFPSKAEYEKALTLRDLYWSAYRRPLEADLDTAEELIHHGYGVSFFAEHLRQNGGWSRQPKGFLTALMYQTAATGSGSSGMGNVTGTAKNLLAHYREFVRTHADEISNYPLDLPGEAILFEAGKRLRVFEKAAVAPLSSQIHRFGLSQSVRRYDKARAVVYAEGTGPARVELRYRTRIPQGWRDLTDEATLIDPLVGIPFGKTSAAGFLLQVIGAFPPTALPISRPSFAVIFLPPPDPPRLPQSPRVSLEDLSERDGTVRIEWTRSDLEGREHFYGYRLTFTTIFEDAVVSKKARRYAFVARRPVFTNLDVFDVLPDAAVEPDAEGVYTLRVTLAEVLDREPGIVGPDSPPAEIEIEVGTSNELERFEGPGNMSGVRIRERFTYYPARRKMPSTWVAGFTPPAHTVWNGNASSWRWVIEGWTGAHADKVIHGKYEMFWQSGKAKGNLLCSAEFRYGVLNGPIAVYHEEGLIGGTGQYVDGKPDGEWPQYGFSGKLIDTAVYDNGHFVERRQAER